MYKCSRFGEGWSYLYVAFPLHFFKENISKTQTRVFLTIEGRYQNWRGKKMDSTK